MWFGPMRRTVVPETRTAKEAVRCTTSPPRSPSSTGTAPHHRPARAARPIRQRHPRRGSGTPPLPAGRPRLTRDPPAYVRPVANVARTPWRPPIGRFAGWRSRTGMWPSAWPPVRRSSAPHWSCSPPDGFDATSSAAIAAPAGVTERTFYRHFPTKESVLFDDYEHRLDWLATALARRPLDEALIDSVVIAVPSYPDDVEIVRQAAHMRRSVLSKERAIAHLQIVQGAFAREITAHALRSGSVIARTPTCTPPSRAAHWPPRWWARSTCGASAVRTARTSSPACWGWPSSTSGRGSPTRDRAARGRRAPVHGGAPGRAGRVRRRGRAARRRPRGPAAVPSWRCSGPTAPARRPPSA